MPAEQDDARVRQLEALRRYVAELGVQRNRPVVETDEPQPASEGQRRPSRPRLLLTGLLVVVALIGGVLVGAVAWSDDRPASSRTAGISAATQRPTLPIAGPMASAACKTAVDRANAMLAAAVRLRRAAVEQGRILRDPANRDLTVGEVLKKLAVSERVGSSESDRFTRALADYRQVVDRCKLQAP
jgi:hypothetical protein